MRTACLVTLTAIAVLATVYLAKAVLMPVTLAVVMALVMRPIVSRLNKWRVPRSLTATALFGAVLGLVVLATMTLADPIREMLRSAPRTLNEVSAELDTYFAAIYELQEAASEIEEAAKAEGGAGEPISVQLERPALTSEALNTTGSYAATTVITLALLFLLLVYGDRFVEKTVQAVPTWRGKREVVETVREVEHRISAYLGSITLINVGLGVVIGVGLWSIGLPHAALWGVLAALLNYIPFAGLAAGTLMVTFAGLAAFDNLAQASLAPLIYLGANGIEANLITPLVLGKSIDLNPVVILLSVLLGGWAWGIVGIFLSVPLLIILRIVAETFNSTKPFAAYLAN